MVARQTYQVQRMQERGSSKTDFSFPEIGHLTSGGQDTYHVVDTYLKSWGRDFSSGPVAKILHSQCRGPGFNPSQGTRSHMLQLRVCMLQLRPTAVK